MEGGKKFVGEYSDIRILAISEFLSKLFSLKMLNSYSRNYTMSFNNFLDVLHGLLAYEKYSVYMGFPSK